MTQGQRRNYTTLTDAICKEWNDLLPNLAPALANSGIFLPPGSGLKGGERLLGNVGI